MRFEDCIECAACVSACPVSGSDASFKGPAALAALERELIVRALKAHAGNIYGKLDVHSRTQAVTRAQALGLLPRS